jgi:hypothetical protein
MKTINEDLDDKSFIALYENIKKLATTNMNDSNCKKLVIDNYKDDDCDGDNCSCTMACVEKSALLNNYNNITITNESEDVINIHVEYLGIIK